MPSVRVRIPARRKLRAALAAWLLAPALVLAQDAAFTGRQCAEDFDTLWKAIDEGYAYFGATRDAWRKSRDGARALAAKAATRPACLLVLANALEQLHDDHVSLQGASFVGPRRVPAETDVWASWIDGAAVVTAVRAGSVADVAGLHPGHEVRSVQGVAIDRVVREMLGKSTGTDAAARDWALRHVMAGPQNGAYLVGVRERGKASLVEVSRVPGSGGNGPPLVARKIGEDRNLGYLRIKNNLGDPALVAHFDAALEHLKDTRGLILDLRETQAGGSEEIASAILGRFIVAPADWQVREPRGKPRAIDQVLPRGPFAYRAPLVVLVDRWTAGEGEALAAGLEAAARAIRVGTQMAGLNGRTRELSLRHTGAVLRFPAERTFHVNGTPREALQPTLAVDLISPSGGPGDPILYQGLKLIDSRTRR